MNKLNKILVTFLGFLLMIALVMATTIITDLKVETVDVNLTGEFITKDPYVDVRAFGATGDGVTDDTAAIQAAIDSISSGIVFFPSGTYQVTGILINKSNIGLQGVGAGSLATKIFTKAGITQPAIHFQGKGQTVNGHITKNFIEDLYVDGNNQAQTLLKLENVSLFRLENIELAGGNTSGLYITESFDSYFEQLTIRSMNNVSSNSIYITSSALDNSNNLRFYATHLEANKGLDIKITDPFGTYNNQISFIDAKIERGSTERLNFNQSVVIDGDYNDDVHFDRCRFINYPNGTTIYISSFGNVFITDSTFWTGASAGKGGTGITVLDANSYIYGNMFSGLDVDINSSEISATDGVYTNNNFRFQPYGGVNINGVVMAQVSGYNGVYENMFSPSDGSIAIEARTSLFLIGDSNSNGAGTSSILKILGNNSFLSGSYDTYLTVLKNGNVGIGDPTPEYKLDIVGNASFGSSSDVVVTDDGKVGIGISSPSTDLHILGNVTIGSSNYVYFNDPGENMRSDAVGSLSIETRGQLNIQGDTNDNGVATSSVLTISEGGPIGGSFNLLLDIQKDGKVGINTSNPTKTLSVNGEANITDTVYIGDTANSKNITMHSPDGTAYTCGVQDGGTFVCNT